MNYEGNELESILNFATLNAWMDSICLHCLAYAEPFYLFLQNETIDTRIDRETIL